MQLHSSLNYKHINDKLSTKSFKSQNSKFQSTSPTKHPHTRLKILNYSYHDYDICTLYLWNFSFFSNYSLCSCSILNTHISQYYCVVYEKANFHQSDASYVHTYVPPFIFYYIEKFTRLHLLTHYATESNVI